MNDMTNRTLVITRVLDAPRELVFDVWTQAKHLAQWWGPKDFTVPFIEMDARVNGTYRACIRSPEGSDHWMRGVFREVVEPERLVFTFAWEDDGKPDHETLVTVTLEVLNGKTLFTFRQAVFETVESRDSHERGWTECFDRLETHLAKVRGSQPG